MKPTERIDEVEVAIDEDDIIRQEHKRFAAFGGVVPNLQGQGWLRSWGGQFFVWSTGHRKLNLEISGRLPGLAIQSSFEPAPLLTICATMPGVTSMFGHYGVKPQPRPNANLETLVLRLLCREL